MKYPHVVKFNGVRYPAGAEVPVESPVEEVQETFTPPTKREVTAMKKSELVELAERNGIKNAETYSAAALKAKIIEMFDL